jgi:hypothetical protein
MPKNEKTLSQRKQVVGYIELSGEAIMKIYFQSSNCVGQRYVVFRAEYGISSRSLMLASFKNMQSGYSISRI